MMSNEIVNIGCRGSLLATTQTQQAGDYIKSKVPTFNFELSILETVGDKVQGSLAQVGGKGAFVSTVEEALVSGNIRLAIHCAKDMPGTGENTALVIGGYLPREDARDVLVSRGGQILNELPSGARIGTSSPRRAFLLKQMREDIEIIFLRGNIDSRLKKVSTGELDAVILAAAGLKRINRLDAATEFLDPSVFIPSVGQGALALQCRADDYEMRKIIENVRCKNTTACVTAERAMLKTLSGDCHSAIGGYCEMNDINYKLSVFVGESKEGQSINLTRTASNTVSPLVFGQEVGEELIRKGGKNLLKR